MLPQKAMKLPGFNAAHDEPGNSQFILGMWQGQADDDSALPIAGGAEPIFKRTLPSYETSDIPTGCVWNMAVGSTGELAGNLSYNLDEFDEQTVIGWTREFNRILVALVSEPDRPWREVVRVAE